MKTKIPFNAGDIVEMGPNRRYMIAGHVWWPVEQRNAYHCLRMTADGPAETAEYIWDHDEDWKLVA